MTTPPIPKRLAIIGRRQPSMLPPPPKPPKPPPRPVSSEKLLLSRSSPNRIRKPLSPPQCASVTSSCKAGRARRLAAQRSRHDSRRQGRARYGLHVRNRAGDRPRAGGRGREADDQR